MTRLNDLPPAQAKRLAELECPDFATTPWVTGPAPALYLMRAIGFDVMCSLSNA
ncbi:MAG TPA: hypothetical protein VH230_03820 [Stellaceae bacterium]|jgi:hypothetical protein|nr:hypothetical protein [Stellaceae bacterium]